MKKYIDELVILHNKDRAVFFVKYWFYVTIILFAINVVLLIPEYTLTKPYGASPLSSTLEFKNALFTDEQGYYKIDVFHVALLFFTLFTNILTSIFLKSSNVVVVYFGTICMYFLLVFLWLGITFAF